MGGWVGRTVGERVGLAGSGGWVWVSGVGGVELVGLDVGVLECERVGEEGTGLTWALAAAVVAEAMGLRT